MSIPTDDWERGEITATWHDRGRQARPAPLSAPGVLARAVVGLCGVLAGGLVALAAGVIGAAVLSARHAMPGPGAAAIAGHVVAAALGVLFAVLADRRAGVARWLGCSGVLVVLGTVLWMYWLN